jgi:hypothetical protein
MIFHIPQDGIETKVKKSNDTTIDYRIQFFNLYLFRYFKLKLCKVKTKAIVISSIKYQDLLLSVLLCPRF